MKKRKWYILISAIALMLCVYARPDVVRAEEEVVISKDTFPDANFRAYVTEHYDWDKDGSLSEWEVETAGSLFLNYSKKTKISSLKGIELLPHISNVYFYNCSFTKDPDFSALSELKDFAMYYCSVKTLDLSRNKSLETLSCTDNTVSSVKLNGADALREAYISWCKLKQLDVSQNKKLTSLNLRDNELTSIDVSGLADLEELNVSANQLKELDVSRNKKLVNVYCSGNPMRLLDLRNNKKDIYTDVSNGYYYGTSYVIVVKTKSDLGWHTYDEQKYYVVDDGGTPKKSHLAVGWTKIGTKTFFFNDENALLTGVQNISGKQYLLGEDGSKKKGWQTYEGETYYLTKDGVITTGLQKIDGKKYFFFDDGPMAASEWVAGKWYNAKGAQTSKRGAWQKDAAGRMYVDNSGRKTTAKWATVDREDYYFDALGYVVKGAKPVGESAVAPTKVKCKINYVTKKKIMNRVNQIRKEAYKLGLIKKYTPVKWSYDMEEIAFLRAAESSFEFGHTRPNGESCFSVEASSGASSHWEVIAGGSNPIGGINMWYGEKDAYIREFNGEKNVGVTGHYGYLINCQYIGIASFGVTCGEGGSATKNAKRYATKKRNTATVELRPDNSELRFEVKTSGEEVTELDLCAGQTLYLQAKLSGMTAVGKWYSLDKSVVKVSSTGKLKGMKAGTATLVFRDGPFSKALTIRVHPPVKKLKWKQTADGKRLGDSKGWYLKKQWVVFKGKCYYFNDDGYMASNEWIDGYYIPASGKCTRKLKGKWVYTKKGSKYKTSKGSYLKNTTVKINGTIYTFNALGYASWSWW